jgi:hypothetical protein
MPPSNSLLFAPNLATPISDAELFRPSPYQTAPPPSQWGDPWVEAPVPPISPPISNSGRNTFSDRKPLCLNFDLDSKDNNWLWYVKEDLPGAVYHYDNDPFAPTAANVAENSLENSLNRRVRDMEISG